MATAPAPVQPPVGEGWRLASAATTIFAAVLLTFLAQISVVGWLQHLGDQRTAYGKFRSDLANGVAPVGQTDLNGALLPLGTPVAILTIDRLGLSEVVGEGTTSGVLSTGPGHRRDTVLPGQVGASVVMGRAAGYGGPFGNLGKLAVGDEIDVLTGQGKHVYRVVGLRRAGDPFPKPVAAGGGTLTLVTADGPAFLPDGVLRVDAQLLGQAAPAPPRVLGAASLTKAEQVMAGDANQWVLLVFWAQALLLAVVALAWLRTRWGTWQVWTVGVPVLAALGLAVADHVSLLLPNLL